MLENTRTFVHSFFADPSFFIRAAILSSTRLGHSSLSPWLSLPYRY
jgi:hypothetical protein